MTSSSYDGPRSGKWQLLEETGETVDVIAERAGFGSATVMRHHFRIWRHTTPHAYRRAFRSAPGSHAA